MRDIALTTVIVIALFYVFRRAWWGILVLAWLAYMNPHRLCYGFAYTLPFFFVATACTGVAILISPEPKRIPWTREIWLLLFLIVWINVSFLFAMNPTGAWWEWSRMMKNMGFVFMSMMVMTDRKRLELLLWAIVLSFGFYGVKGGIFTVIRGGSSIVVGPDETFIADNNHFAVALAMVIPLMRYLQLQTANKWVRSGLTVMMALCSFAIVGTYSRAGFVSLAVVALVMWLKSRRKLVLLCVVLALAMIVVPFMPEKWADRMHTIQHYDEDASVLGRFNAWGFAYNIANARPLVGGGPDSFRAALFRLYAPDPDNVHAAHSIYFQMLGDNGYPGLFFFVFFFALTWLGGSWVRRQSRTRSDLMWAGDMTAMIQTSLFVYAVGGGTLSLAYFDLPYQLATMIVMCRVITLRQLDSDEFEEIPLEIELEPSSTAGCA